MLPSTQRVLIESYGKGETKASDRQKTDITTQGNPLLEKAILML